LTDPRKHDRRIAITHPLMGRGGSEAAVMWGIQALKDDNSVTLVTAGRVGPKELDDLNAFYGTSLNWGEFRVQEAPHPPLLSRKVSAAALRGALCQRFCQKVARRFDVLVSAYNVCDFGVPAIHLVCDIFREEYDGMSTHGIRRTHRDGALRRAYLCLCRWVANPSGRSLYAGEDVLVANSNWTAGVVTRRLAASRVGVLYPPVVGEFPQLPFAEKECGFVCLGRVSQEKRIEDVIEIAGRLCSLLGSVVIFCPPRVLGRLADGLLK
jgi:hypothetical protein